MLAQNPSTKDYIHTLEQLCNNQSEVCKVYLEVIELQEQDLQCKKRRISVLEKQYAMATEQNKLREKIITITSDTLSKAESGWWEKYPDQARADIRINPDAKNIMSIRNLWVDMSGETVRNVDLDIKEGEILGIGGLAGQGKLGIPNGIMGLCEAGGKVEFDGKPIPLNNPENVWTPLWPLFLRTEGTWDSFSMKPLSGILHFQPCRFMINSSRNTLEE